MQVQRGESEKEVGPDTDDAHGPFGILRRMGSALPRKSSDSQYWVILVVLPAAIVQYKQTNIFYLYNRGGSLPLPGYDRLGRKVILVRPGVCDPIKFKVCNIF